ncbi:phosphatidylserine decarboxylase [Pseudonocardia halophobica]|uniref:Phosphatidylserine decarboxylase proenzyme n=1 Tax=Pseudonocardia halophobica TaxID=29401 RepID=A0A9W6L4X2_9PSEU|nr:phosphatidylserine decarboxylase [Pseudonocardia halophobica]GLL13727.1 phosphatidylserine decarboxylase proenzyme [Pseudonocardia halophobica]
MAATTPATPPPGAPGAGPHDRPGTTSELHSAGAPPATGGENPVLHAAKLVREAVPPLHPGGRPIIAAVAAAAGAVRLLTGRGTGVGLLATAATAAFFRAPRRVPPPRPGAVLAPADGTVALISEVVPPAELDLPREPVTRVSVFLSVLDVHVQRIPMHGRIRSVEYRPGAFLSADLDKASEDNERNALVLETQSGHLVGVVQIAGLLARRIRCDVKPGDEVAAGETYGLIRFGSRVDTYLPPGVAPEVSVGQRTIGGETVLADLAVVKDAVGQEAVVNDAVDKDRP